jgi:hypothetical protein
MRIRLRPTTSLIDVDRSRLILNWSDGTCHLQIKWNYLGVIFDRRITWRLHTEAIEAKAFRTFFLVYFLFKSERLNTNIKLTRHKALIRSKMTYAYPAWEFAADTHLWNSSACKIRFSAPLTILQGAHRSVICTRLVCGYQNWVCLRFNHTIMQAKSRGHTKLLKTRMFVT